jgi:hypothetical protein
MDQTMSDRSSKTKPGGAKQYDDARESGVHAKRLTNQAAAPRLAFHFPRF